MKKANLNSLSAGVISGLILPALCFILVILYKKGDYAFAHYLGEISKAGITPRLLSLCLLPNLILFFVFMRNDRLKSARGVIISMFIAGIAIVILKLI